MPRRAQVAAERVEGVREAKFAYPDGTAVVTYDPTVTSDSVIIAEVERATGFGVASQRLRDLWQLKRYSLPALIVWRPVSSKPDQREVGGSNPPRPMEVNQ